jgi:hypothetical protein
MQVLARGTTGTADELISDDGTGCRVLKTSDAMGIELRCSTNEALQGASPEEDMVDES